jgi:hypothetical protein
MPVDFWRSIAATARMPVCLPAIAVKPSRSDRKQAVLTVKFRARIKVLELLAPSAMLPNFA